MELFVSAWYRIVRLIFIVGCPSAEAQCGAWG